MSEYEEIDPRFKESLLNWMKTNNPFWSLLGMELTEVRDGQGTLIAKGLATYAITKK